ARLRIERQRSGLSLREVARQLGVSPSFVSQLENGKSQPSVATLYSIAQLLDVSIDELFATEGGEVPAQQAAPPVSSPEAVRQLRTRKPSPINRSELGSPADAWPDDRVP